AIAEQSAFANVVEEAVDSQPAELDLWWLGDPAQQGREQGLIWTRVRARIEQAERLMAFIDLPNANVGFEIGYAFGKEKAVAVYRFLARKHAWHEAPPLRGLFRNRLFLVDDIHRAALDGEYMQSRANAEGGGDGVLFLCPARSGDAFQRVVPLEWGWRHGVQEPWDLETIHQQLVGIGLVVWIIVPSAEGDEERDGVENAALSVLAGYALARPELVLKVFIHRSARSVADVAERAVPFSRNAELREALQQVARSWARRSTPTPPPRVPAERPAALPPLPADDWASIGRRFMGRRRQLLDAAEAVWGLVERFGTGRDGGDGHQVELIWVHGFGGMGKSWYLHRVRAEAEAAHPALRSLVIDFDAPSPWSYPLIDRPKTPQELFDPLAFRLAQRLSVADADPYWVAKARVAASAADHHRLNERFQHQIAVAKTADSDQVEPSVRRLLEQALTSELWELPADQRGRRIMRWADDGRALSRAFEAWCVEAGVVDPAVNAPDRILAAGLAEALRAATKRHPLLLLLDTAQLLPPDLQTWLRELLVPLLREARPLLVLVGSRSRPDGDQAPGSTAGWLAELPAGAVRVEPFDEMLRLNVMEIESALGKLTRPVRSDRVRIAEQLERVTLGVPLAMRTVLDLHEQGD
ncbi:MAG TPA: hypothetical protein VN914_11715, partial [Polyangia bacterium]|nr:hypothetical protein [Polyangia bacterium]